MSQSLFSSFVRGRAGLLGGGALSVAVVDALRAAGARWSGRPPIEEGRRQLPEFIAMTRRVVSQHEGPAACVAGEIPPELEARYFAGGWYTRPSPPIDFLLDAYSSMLGWYLRDGRAHVRVRPIVDPIRDQEIAEGRILRKGLMTQLTGGPLARVSYDIGRTSLHECIAHGGSIIGVAARRCVLVDPETLAPRPRDAFQGLFDEEDPSVIHNNHPQVDPTTGNLVSFFSRVTTSFATEVEFFEHDAQGQRVGQQRHFSPSFNAVHAFGFSRSSYLLPDNPLTAPGLRFVLGLDRGALDGIDDDPTRGLAIHVIPREPGSPGFTARFSQRGFIYHVLNSHDDGDLIVLDAFVSNLNPAREASQFELDPARSVWTNLGGIFRFTIDRRRGEARSRLLLPGVQRVTFDCIDERVRGLPHRRAWFVANDQHEGGRSEVIAADLAAASVQRWSTPDRVFFRQPRFVPAPGAAPEGEGWLLIPAYTPAGSNLMIFDAARVAQGPVAVVAAGVLLPYTNHGCVG